MKNEQHFLNSTGKSERSVLLHLKKDIKTYRVVYLMLIPVVAYYLIFHYWPMYGVIIAFKDFKPMLGFAKSPWVGMEKFTDFFGSIYFGRLIKNTVWISFLSLLFGFPAPILFAILLNEIKHLKYKKFVQTVTYLPHFLSMVIICGLVILFTNSTGFLTRLFSASDGIQGGLISDPKYFRAIYVVSGIWADMGWGSIIYLAAITGIDDSLYESAYIDGANKFKQILHVTIPGILPTVVIMFVLQVGGMMNIGWEKAFLLQTPLTYEASDIISTFVYRKGFQDLDYSYSTAVGLFNSLINCALIYTANTVSRKLSETSLW